MFYFLSLVDLFPSLTIVVTIAPAIGDDLPLRFTFMRTRLLPRASGRLRKALSRIQPVPYPTALITINLVGLLARHLLRFIPPSLLGLLYLQSLSKKLLECPILLAVPSIRASDRHLAITRTHRIRRIAHHHDHMYAITRIVRQIILLSSVPRHLHRLACRDLTLITPIPGERAPILEIPIIQDIHPI